MSALSKSVLSVLAASFAMSASFAADFDELLTRVPDQANCLLMIDVEGAHKSSLGVAEKWATRRRHAPISGFSDSSPLAKRIVMAGELNPTTLQMSWQVAIVRLVTSVSQADLKKAVSGTSDSTGGHEMFLTPQNSFVSRFDPAVVGVMRPANRQPMARWVRSANAAGRVKLPDYLRAAANGMPKDAQAVMAFDLADVFDTPGMAHRLRNSKALKNKEEDAEKLTKLFADLRGFTLTLRVDSVINGELRLDFDGQPAGVSADSAKSLFLEGLDAIGAGIEEFDTWRARIDGKSVVMTGILSERCVRHAFSPFLTPASEMNAGGTPDASPESIANASQQYFGSVSTLLADLKLQKSKTNTQLSYWYKQFADKIDSLPMANVDEELAKYGAAVSMTIRGIGNLAINSQRQQRMIADNRGEYLAYSPNAYQYYGGGPGWGFGYSVPGVMATNNYAETNNMIAQTANTEVALRNDTWKNIDKATADIRIKMVQKYKVEFK